MSERELDSSVNEYNEIEVNEYQTKQSEWDMAIGLQEVDNLKPSPYLQKLLEENVTGEMTVEEVISNLKEVDLVVSTFFYVYKYFSIFI